MLDERPTPTQNGLPAVLSPREAEVLGMVASLGLTNAQIAEQLHVSIHAIKFHLAAVYRKLGVANRTEAAVAFTRASQHRGPDGGEIPLG
jgi:two-component system nitrate/nitrite response regulator NarL